MTLQLMVKPPLEKFFDIEPNNSDGDAFDEEACVIRDSDEDMHSDDF